MNPRQPNIHDFTCGTGVYRGIHKFEQKARFHEKHAKMGILIRDLQWGNGHPYTWSGIFENRWKFHLFPGHKL